MPRLYLIAHAPLASALKAVAAHVFPEAAEEVVALDVQPQQSAEAIEQAVRADLAGMGHDEVLVLTDVFGATPCNVARHLVERPSTRVLVGANVPMLWRALAYRHEPLERLSALAMAGASQGVMQLAASRPQNQVQKPASHDPHDHHDHQ